ncbi:MAG: hypothetical protein OXN25_20985 [Candidatus Poribacteria bacterium]|nr:hypothetical protein [Candidatus Poribacteria bacterium]
MRLSLCRIIAIVCILSIGITGSLLLAPMSEADPSEYIYETHEYWTRCINIPSSPHLSFTNQEVYANGWHEGDHWSGGNDYVPPHDITRLYRTVYHLSWVWCEAA